MKVRLGAPLLGANELIALRNRQRFAEQSMLVLNLLSSPGAGKTTILERSIELLGDTMRIGVIEGDLYTDADAKRIEQKGVRVIQINTEGGCHLDADMVNRAWVEMDAGPLDLLIIENVGNLVCPAEFDLGEDYKVVVLSTAEGNDKVLKYPLVFREAKAIILNKIDLLPYTDFSLDRFYSDLARINPDAPIFKVSGRSGDGMKDWEAWLSEEVKRKAITKG